MGKKTSFVEAFEGVENRVHAIFVFLCILELIQEQKVKITIGEGYNNFWIEKTDGPVEEIVVEEEN